MSTRFVALSVGALLLFVVLSPPSWTKPGQPPLPTPARVVPAPKPEKAPQLITSTKPLTLAIGEPHTLIWRGGGKKLPVLVDLDPDIAEVEIQAGRCRITGKKSCDITVILDWGKGGPRWNIPLSFRPPAGRVPDPLRVNLTGNQDLEEAIRHQLLAHQVSQAKCEVAVEADAKNPGELRAKVQFSAPGFLTVAKTVHLNVERGALTPVPAELLYLSNRPEKVDQVGILMDEPWQGTSPCRLLFHHKCIAPGDPDLFLEVRCRNLGAEANFHLALSTLGPAKDEIYVGHLATQHFLEKVTGRSLASWRVHLPANREICLERIRMRPGQTVSGVALLVPEGNVQAQLRVLATHADGSGAEQQLPDSGPAGRTARGMFPAEIEQSYRYPAGERYLFIQLGGLPYLEDPQTHEKSPGNFGAVYRYTLVLTNPTAEDYEFSISASARGGPARGHFYVDGILKDPGNIGANPAVLQRWHLAGGEERKVVLETLPQSGSNYPVELVVGAIKCKPAPPDPTSVDDHPRRIP